MSLGVCRSPYPGNWRCLFLRAGLVQKEKSWGEDTEGAGWGGGDGGSIPAIAPLGSWALPGQVRLPEPFLLVQHPQNDSLLRKGWAPVYRSLWEEGFSLRWAQTCFSLSLVI